jgi:hypothetical protein
MVEQNHLLSSYCDRYQLHTRAVSTNQIQPKPIAFKPPTLHCNDSTSNSQMSDGVLQKKKKNATAQAAF